METPVPQYKELDPMVGDYSSVALKKKQESFLYRVFSASSVHELTRQQFTYLGAEIYFDKHGKVHRYEEPVFDFDGFHAFLRDKYENYHIDEFILVTREGQFNLRYFPLTQYSPREYTELVDDIEVISFHMFPDLLPIGTDLLLSVLNSDPMEDIEASIEKFEKLLGLIVGDGDAFLKVQILMNLVKLNVSRRNVKHARKYYEELKTLDEMQSSDQLLLCRHIRSRLESIEIMGKDTLQYDWGSIQFWNGIILRLETVQPNQNIITAFISSIKHWEQIETYPRDLLTANYNLAAYYFGFENNAKEAQKYYLKVIDRISLFRPDNFSDELMLIDAFCGIFDLKNAYSHLQMINIDALSAHEQEIYDRTKATIELYINPQAAYRTLMETLERAQRNNNQLIQPYGLFHVLIDAIYINRDAGLFDDLPLFSEYVPQDLVTLLESFSEVIGQVLKSGYDASRKLLLNQIQDSSTTEVFKRKLMWIISREILENLLSGVNQSYYRDDLEKLTTLAREMREEELEHIFKKILEIVETDHVELLSWIEDQLVDGDENIFNDPMNYMMDQKILAIVDNLFIRMLLLRPIH